MEKVVSKLTVLFEDPFWIGLYERMGGGRYEVCKITFGAEPKDGEVYAFLLDNWRRLRFSPPIAAQALPERKLSPKRMQREAKRQTQAGVGTKAQQALQQMREQMQTQRKVRSREQREAQKERKFFLRQEKRKEKHAGH